MKSTNNKITQAQIENMREKFIAKRIFFETESGERWVGTCQFLGYNDFLPSWGFQITIDRTPVQHVKPDSINLL
jgi:hypothetical protein